MAPKNNMNSDKKVIIKLGKKTISHDSDCFVIAEIGHNHQGNLRVALDLIKSAAECGVDAVKFQKRDNKALFTKAMYNKPYDNENSFGITYGEHREFLEFNMKQFQEIKKCCKENNVEFMCTAFDIPSVNFLEKLGINSYKIASGDLNNIPLLQYIAKKGKPMFISTGAAMLEEIHEVYNAINIYNVPICFLHTTCSYPTEYSDLHLKAITTLKNDFPNAIIGYSGHDNGILAAVICNMLGATVIEKHFTLNRAWKGTDHKFSLEREGLRKQVRDLKRIKISLGSPKKIIRDVEIHAKAKMGKSLYASKNLVRGHILRKSDISMKSPGGGISPNRLKSIIGLKLKVKMNRDDMFFERFFYKEK